MMDREPSADASVPAYADSCTNASGRGYLHWNLA